MVDYIWKGREEATKCLARSLVTAVQGRAMAALVNVLCILFQTLKDMSGGSYHFSRNRSLLALSHLFSYCFFHSTEKSWLFIKGFTLALNCRTPREQV